MNEMLLQREPKALWKFFEQLNAIPRASKKEQRVIQFMKDFGEGLELETIVDPAGNVIIRKPAAPGREDRPGVIMQGHLDMVHQKNSDTNFDFETEGIRSYIDSDGWLKARGTTLGADNGVGVASIMAVLAADDISHGPMEALFTIDEETGMTGAFELQPGVLTGSILLNTDTEDEGELCIGCAGGVDTDIQFSYEESKPTSSLALRLSLTGLKGGHSGCEIHLGRGNANKIMNRLLWSCRESDLAVAELDGGSLRNAIPRESFATIVIDPSEADAVKAKLQDQFDAIAAELSRTEPDMKLKLQSVDAPARVMTAASQQRLLNAIYAAPCGVLRMSNEMEGLVETSTSMARVSVSAGEARVQFLTRSSVESAKQDTANMIQATFELAGATVTHSGSYPGWKPNSDSAILELMKQIYEEQFGEPPIVNAVHAGLECGIIGSVYPGLDMISFGPTIKNPHSPDEKCDLESVKKYWQFLVATLERI